MAAFGQDAVPIQAGDQAPPLVWTKILRSPEASGREPGNLFGRVTVLAFFPNVSANESLVTQWNELIAEFADEPVNFIWITSEQETTLNRWLQKHPVSGWLLLDAKNDTARAYGIDAGGGVLIDTDVKIAGFTFMLPSREQIRAVQEYRVLAIHGDATDAQMNALLAGRAVRLDAEPRRSQPPDEKRDIPPSYEVHISPSSTRGTVSSEGPDYFVQRGFDVKALISRVYEKDPSRIVLPASLNEERTYDVVLVLPSPMDQAEIYRLVQRAFENHFRISTTVEYRPKDVYVMTALEGKTPAPKTGQDSFGGGFITWSSEWRELAPHDDTPPTIEMLRKMLSDQKVSTGAVSQISASNTTINDFRLALEQALGRPVVDETNLKGVYDISVHGKPRSAEDFLQLLSEQAGIIMTPARRNIEMLVVQPLP